MFLNIVCCPLETISPSAEQAGTLHTHISGFPLQKTSNLSCFLSIKFRTSSSVFSLLPQRAGIYLLNSEGNYTQPVACCRSCDNRMSLLPVAEMVLRCCSGPSLQRVWGSPVLGALPKEAEARSKHWELLLGIPDPLAECPCSSWVPAASETARGIQLCWYWAFKCVECSVLIGPTCSNPWKS